MTANISSAMLFVSCVVLFFSLYLAFFIWLIFVGASSELLRFILVYICFGFLVSVFSLSMTFGLVLTFSDAERSYVPKYSYNAVACNEPSVAELNQLTCFLNSGFALSAVS